MGTIIFVLAVMVVGGGVMLILQRFPAFNARQEATKQRRAAAKAQRREDRDLLREEGEE